MPLRHNVQQIFLAFASVSGMAAVEFAFLVPILLMLTVCTVDLGLAFYSDMRVENAAQAGSEYATVHGYNAASISSAITSATGLSGLTASPAPTEFCGCPSAGSGVTTVTCGSTCSDGTYAGTYVTSTATATYTTLIHYPMLPSHFTFVDAATARIQ